VISHITLAYSLYFVDQISTYFHQMAPQMFLFGSREWGRLGINQRALRKSSRRHSEMCIHKAFQQESDCKYNTSNELWNPFISKLLRVTITPGMLYQCWEIQRSSYRGLS